VSPSLTAFALDEPIFVDANIFLFHAFNDKNFGMAATAFLTRVENQDVKALTSSLVVDEVLFKILIQEAAIHLPKPTIWNIKRAMKDKAVSQKFYAPVLKYKGYLESLTFLGLKIVEVTGMHMLAAADIGVEAGLLITDAAHVAVMRDLNVRHLATDDADLAGITGITAWTP
jgi:predicted nucleic acid-binding protein